MRRSSGPILIDICHPAHAHFFKNPIRLLRERGHEVLVTSRVKEVATDLLDGIGIEHYPLSVQSDGSLAGLFRELVVRDYRLFRYVRRHGPRVLAAIGGTFVSHVGWLSRIPALVFYDTETARLQNAITYPLATRICVPDCYYGPLPEGRTTRYRGYHELSYLHPAWFRPDRNLAERNGLAPTGDTFLVRLVSWQANHDVGDAGWTNDLLRHVVNRLCAHGRVLISAEAKLSSEFAAFRFAGDPAAIHHVMAFCRGYIGESATMASECAVLGVPAVYVARTRLGYMDEQQEKYGLVRNIRAPERTGVDAAVDWLLAQTRESCHKSMQRLHSDSVDVPRFVADMIEQFC